MNVIHAGELAFTQFLLRHGFSVGVLCPYDEAARRTLFRARERLWRERHTLLKVERTYLLWLAEAISRGEHLNPAHSFWDTLVLECGCPFIKRDLLRRNPLRIPGLLDWSDLLAGLHAGDIDIVRRHLMVD